MPHGKLFNGEFSYIGSGHVSYPIGEAIHKVAFHMATHEWFVF